LNFFSKFSDPRFALEATFTFPIFKKEEKGSSMKYNLAELNVGRLVAPTDDPRVKDFMDNLDFINGLGKRMPGFVWMMEGSGEPGMGNTDAKIGDDPQYVSNLTVWKDVESLEKFVWGTVHKKFYERREEWFEVLGEMHFVMWWVPEGHEPTLEEALARLEMRRQNGDSDEAFGWDWLKAAQMHRTHACAPAA
jgi:Domain of unknown function (DUF3291).